MELLSFLEKYNSRSKDIEVITDECTGAEYEAIPDQWKRLIKASQAEKNDIIIEMWQAVVKEEMPLTIATLKERLEDVFIVRFGDEYSLIYLIKDQNGDMIYYIGFVPAESFIVQDEMPESIKNFYTKLHNGFYRYSFKAYGLFELERVTPLSDVVDGNDEADMYNYKKAYVILGDGGGNYVVYYTISKMGMTWYKGDGLCDEGEIWSLVDGYGII